MDLLLGCSEKARRELGWKPRVSFDELVAMMVDSDLGLARREQVLMEAGLDISRARQLLGWTPRQDFDAGLAATVTWWREQGNERRS